MAQTMMYTCDICKQSKSKGELANINVSAKGIKMKGAGYNGIEIDICPNCLKNKGFVVEEKPTKEEQEQAEAKNKVTLEDRIYDILQDMGVVFAE